MGQVEMTEDRSSGTFYHLSLSLSNQSVLPTVELAKLHGNVLVLSAVYRKTVELQKW